MPSSYPPAEVLARRTRYSGGTFAVLLQGPHNIFLVLGGVGNKDVVLKNCHVDAICQKRAARRVTQFGLLNNLPRLFRPSISKPKGVGVLCQARLGACRAPMTR